MTIRRLLCATSGCLFLLLAVSSRLPAADQPEPSIPDADLLSTVDERIEAWWPTADEKRFDEIGWAADLHEARRLAREHDRPIFLFTMDGRVNTGRC